MFTKTNISPESAATFTAILVLWKGPLQANGIFDNIEISGTTHWYMPLTPFEAVFIGLFLVQVYTLQMLGITPINLNKLFYKRPSGRRKRECRMQEDLDELIFKIVFKLDKHECVARSLCELQKNIRLGQFECPVGIKQILREFSRFNPKTTNSTGSVNKYRLFYMKAVKLGQLVAARSTRTHSTNSTDECDLHYSTCPLKSNEILTYVNQMRLDEFID